MMGTLQPNQATSARMARVRAAGLVVLAALPLQAPLAAGVCGLEIAGLWKPATTRVGGEIVLLEFSPDGRVTLLAGQPDAPPRELELIGAVEYELARDSEHVEFDAARGIEMFPRGSSRWDITGHGDETFAARRSDVEGAQEKRWTRVQIKRYFLTLAARSRAADGGPAAFVIWTEVGARGIRRAALGLYAERASSEDAAARFGHIPDDLAEAFATGSERETDVMLRLELNEAQYGRTREMFAAWDVLLRNGLLDDDDPRRQAAELVAAVVQSANRCGRAVVGLGGLDLDTFVEGPPRDEADDAARPIELIRGLEDENERIHVDDNEFPWEWQPS